MLKTQYVRASKSYIVENEESLEVQGTTWNMKPRATPDCIYMCISLMEKMESMLIFILGVLTNIIDDDTS